MKLLQFFPSLIIILNEWSQISSSPLDELNINIDISNVLIGEESVNGINQNELNINKEQLILEEGLLVGKKEGPIGEQLDPEVGQNEGLTEGQGELPISIQEYGPKNGPDINDVSTVEIPIGVQVEVPKGKNPPPYKRANRDDYSFGLGKYHHYGRGNENVLVSPITQSPDMYQVQLNTDITDRPIIVEVNRTLAPIGADRFYNLVKDGFYDGGALFRVVPGFVLQFGISGNPDQNEKWLHRPILDDPVIGSNLRGSITFAAESNPNTRTTQVFINYEDNSRLDARGFAPFGVVITGLDVAMTVYNPTPGSRGGVDQDEYEEKGNGWIEEAYPGINFIEKAVLYN